jgi:predicted amidophosphoribosyltransferase
MRIGTFFERVKTALQNGACLHCRRKAPGQSPSFCPRCRELLGFRDPQAVMSSEGVSYHAATRFNAAVRKVLYGYKFHGQRDREPLLAGLLTSYWANLAESRGMAPIHPENVLVVPVPPHEGKGSRVDGFAKRFARHFGYDYRPEVLGWAREVLPQHTIHERRERLRNIAGGLALRHFSGGNYQRIIVTDDLMTTGATLREACRALGETPEHESQSATAQREILGLAVSRVPLLPGSATWGQD